MLFLLTAELVLAWGSLRCYRRSDALYQRNPWLPTNVIGAISVLGLALALIGLWLAQYSANPLVIAGLVAACVFMLFFAFVAFVVMRPNPPKEPRGPVSDTPWKSW